MVYAILFRKVDPLSSDRKIRQALLFSAGVRGGHFSLPGRKRIGVYKVLLGVLQSAGAPASLPGQPGLRERDHVPDINLPWQPRNWLSI